MSSTLSSRMSWSDQASIACALLMAYPEADRLSLSMQELARLIAALPQHPLEAPPSEKFLQAVLWTWMRLAEEESGP